MSSSYLYLDDAEYELESYLLQHLNLHPRKKIKEAFIAKKILINSRPAKRHDLLRKNDRIDIMETGLFKTDEIKLQANANLNLPLLLSNKSILVVNKPAGLHAHPQVPSETNSALNFLVSANQEAANYFRPERPLEGGLIHRIDQGTSGILACALKKDAYEKLKRFWKSENSEKIYLAWVAGSLDLQATLKTHLYHDPKNKKKMNACLRTQKKEKSWEAVTSIQTLRQNKSSTATLALIRIHTGVTHQIRATLAALGHPVLGDELYSTVKPKPDQIAIDQLDKKTRKSFEKLVLEVPTRVGLDEITAPTAVVKPRFFLHAFWIKIYGMSGEDLKELGTGLLCPVPEYF